MQILRFQVEETFTTRLLGSSPADKGVYQEFIAKKKAEAEEKRRKFAERHGTEGFSPVGTMEEEVETINEDTGVTVFHNDLGQMTEDGKPGRGLFLYDYQIMGYYKETAEILQEEHGILQPRSKLDNFMRVVPRRVYIYDADGNVLQNPDGQLERPLRGMTLQGPRVSLACSHYINPGRHVKYTLEILPYLKAGRGKEARKIDVDRFVEMLAKHGSFKGRGQWRNGGNGRFEAEVKALGLPEAKA